MQLEAETIQFFIICNKTRCLQPLGEGQFLFCLTLHYYLQKKIIYLGFWAPVTTSVQFVLIKAGAIFTVRQCESYTVQKVVNKGIRNPMLDTKTCRLWTLSSVHHAHGTPLGSETELLKFLDVGIFQIFISQIF